MHHQDLFHSLQRHAPMLTAHQRISLGHAFPSLMRIVERPTVGCVNLYLPDRAILTVTSRKVTRTGWIDPERFD